MMDNGEMEVRGSNAISWLDRESSTNSRAPGASTKDKGHQSRRDSSSRNDQTYTKRHRDKLLQGSLENVSSNPLGDVDQQESTLRRSRSLAISREDVFTNLEIPNATRNRRSQLIPRAKLIDRYSSRDRSLVRGLSQESLYISDRTLLKRKSSVTGEQAVPQHCPSTGHKHHPHNRQQGDEHDPQFIHLNSYQPPPAGEEIDSLDSNYHNKTSLNTVYAVSNEDLTFPDGGLSLPNYYPDSKCDTDLSFTDNISLNETVTSIEPILSSKDSPQCFKRGDKYRQSELNHPENISYDDNIVFTKNTLYDGNYYQKSKPRTIRGSTPYTQEIENYYSGKPRSLPNYASNGDYESDTSLSDYDPKYYEPVEKTSSENGASNGEATELESEDISKLINNDNDKENVYVCKSDFTNIEANPIYDEIPLVTDIAPSCKEAERVEESAPIKTSIQVQGLDSEHTDNSEEYKTIVSVSDEKSLDPSESEEGSPKEAKKHSHNYLKEFLETQKGSKKPLQNFLSKRISRAFNGDKDKNKAGKKTASNLVENQYFSLPDITISKSLQKCEKIDRKLRKCESKLTKSPSDISTNRFIVNIGNHFDVTAHSSIPVDFELKISKIPKSQKSKKQKQPQEERERNFLDAVKNLKDTLNNDKQLSDEDNIPRPEAKINKIIVNGEEIQSEDLYQRDKEVEVIIEDTNVEKMGDIEINKEYQEKIHNMRNYWGNIINDNKEKSDPVKEDSEGKEQKCKIVGVHTKVEEVKKKFEPPEEKPEKQPSIVQMTKQIFEKNAEKCERRGILENPFFERESSCQYESLNPNTIELEETKPEEKQITNHNKSPLQQEERKISKIPHKLQLQKHKRATPIKNIASEQEFDHIRYRVMKSDLFQKKIFANCEKESQFDGLMQYLQDYSFQELLIDNNIVIIEPIRTNVQYIGTNKPKTTRNITQFIRKQGKPPESAEGSALRKHFFYHPIRVNREVNDDELPNPDTVKQVRQMFEGALPRSHSSKNLETITKQTVQYRTVDPDKDRCSATDSNSSNISECGSNENFFETLDNDICCDQYVSEDILEKIRECGTSVTYYGGRVLNKRNGKSITMTKAIMDEIQNQKRRPECSCRRNSQENRIKSVTFIENNKPSDNETYQGVKFKLLKSNSCSSRLELVGTKNLSDYRNKFINKQKELIQEHNLKKQNEYIEKATINLKSHSKKELDKNAVNENIKEKSSPKIIGEEMKPGKKLVQWGEMKEDKSYSGITYTKAPQKITYDYHNFDNKVKPKAKKLDDMEFEPYEIAGN